MTMKVPRVDAARSGELQIQLNGGDRVDPARLQIIHIRDASGELTTLTRCGNCEGFFFGGMWHLPMREVPRGRRRKLARREFADVRTICRTCAGDEHLVKE